MDHGCDIEVAAEVAPDIAGPGVSRGEGAAGGPGDASCRDPDGILLFECWCCILLESSWRGYRLLTSKGEGGKAENGQTVKKHLGDF